MASYAGAKAYTSNSYSKSGQYHLSDWQPSWYRPLEDVVADWIGLNQMREKQKSQAIQRDYDNYMRAGNLRALNDWNKNLGSKGLKIRYPELSYGGALRGYDTAISRSYVSSAIAGSEFTGSFPYRTAGLYGIFGRPARYL